jgi:hypothetical protein
MTEASTTNSNATSTESRTSSHAAWCRRHEDDDQGGWCNTQAVELAGTYLEVTNGTTDGRILLTGLDEIRSDRAGVDLDTAEQVARAVLQLVEQARTPLEHHSWCDYPDHDLAGEHCSSRVVDFTSTKPDDGTVPEAGWWGWLAAPADDDLVNLVVGGRPRWADESFASMCFEVPVWHVGALRDVVEDDGGRKALDDLLKRMPR